MKINHLATVDGSTLFFSDRALFNQEKEAFLKKAAAAFGGIYFREFDLIFLAKVYFHRSQGNKGCLDFCIQRNVRDADAALEYCIRYRQPG
jgi:hypothetical protein